MKPSMPENPLLTAHQFPPFTEFTLGHIEPALNARIDAVFETLERCLKTIDEQGVEPDWNNLVGPMEAVQDQLNQTWSPISHLNSVANSEALRDIYSRAIQRLTEFGTQLDQHKPLFLAYKALAESDAFNRLDSAQQKVIHDALKDFRLSGIDLSDEKKHEYGEIKKQLSDLSTQFSNNVLDATAAWYWHTENKDDLAGLPDSALAVARAAAEKKSLTGYVITLDLPSYLAVMMHGDNRSLRETLYRAYVTRASAEGQVVGEEDASQWDNTPIIDKTLALRHQLATLLGFDNYSELSLAKKMADHPQDVETFLLGLSEKSRPFAERDRQELFDFAQATGDIDELEPWDLSYYSEKLKAKKYSVSEEELRPYFPSEKVISGLFEVAHRLFNIDIEETLNPNLWHEDARFYSIKKEGNIIAYFYFDLFAREHKRGGAWMADAQSRRVIGDEIQLPIAYLTCNFTPPAGGKPSLLTFNEVTTLFHEFGHGLHHMLTDMRYAAISGISGVPWDAVELPSQFLENWCWQPEVIPLISGHYQTGEPLPSALLEKMLAAKNFQSGLQMLRQIEFSLFDMRLHSQYNPQAPESAQAVLDNVRDEVAVMIPPAFNRFQNSFSHIFAGGYAAGYYSYKWAEVLSADAFSLFEEQGIFNKNTGEQFLKHILSQGGSKEPTLLFKQFRGRAPEQDALLRHSGMAEATS